MDALARKAEIIRPLDGYRGEAWLVRHAGRYYVVSYANVPFSGPETLVFPGNEDGTVASWGEVAGGRGMGPAEAIADLEATEVTMPIHKAIPEDAGCYVDGHWGQYAVAHMVNRAEEFGYDDAEVIDLAARKLAAMMPSDAPDLTFDEEEALSDAADEVEAWLNEHVAPEGYSFGWYEGEFYLWPDATWTE